MKKFLLFLSVLATFGLWNKSYAQCEIVNFSNVSIQLVGTPIDLGSGRTQITFNAQFDLEYNSGAKFVYFTSYLAADYNTLSTSAPLDFDCGNPTTPAKNMPTETRLGRAISEVGKSFLDLGLDLSSAGPVLGGPALPVSVLTSYPADLDVVLTQPSNSLGLTVTREKVSGNIDHFVANNVTVIINQPIGAPIDVRTDIFATNSAAGTKAQCYLCGKVQLFNDPSVTGRVACGNPRTATFNITTISTSLINVDYKVYVDANNNGTYEASSDLLTSLIGSTPISSTQPFNMPPTSYGPYASGNTYLNNDLIVIVSGATLSNSITQVLENNDVCIPLPVSFKSVSATRNKSTVAVKWTTSTESNNKGFNVQRNTGGVWETVAFVFSAATGGNSTSDLSYSFNDANAYKGVTQYRIQQVDIDGRSKLSEIRSVKGETMAANMLVYPNPSETGRVSVVFEDGAQKNVQVSDMSGRVVRSFKGVTNNVSIEGLETGVYSIQVTDLFSAALTVEKVIIKKR